MLSKAKVKNWINCVDPMTLKPANTKSIFFQKMLFLFSIRFQKQAFENGISWR
jgi:hypothetical protein